MQESILTNLAVITFASLYFNFILNENLLHQCTNGDITYRFISGTALAEPLPLSSFANYLTFNLLPVSPAVLQERTHFFPPLIISSPKESQQNHFLKSQSQFKRTFTIKQIKYSGYRAEWRSLICRIFHSIELYFNGNNGNVCDSNDFELVLATIILWKQMFSKYDI